MKLERTTIIQAPPEQVFEFFSSPANLAILTPKSLGFQIIDAPARPLRAGDRIRYRIRVAGIPLTWVTHITSWNAPHSFADSQEKGPYRRWVHTHSFRAHAEGTEMRDEVDYELPFGLPGAIIGKPFVKRQLKMIFDYRAEKIGEIFGAKSQTLK